MQLFITILVVCLLVGSYAQRFFLLIRNQKHWIMPEDEFKLVLNLVNRNRSRAISKHLRPQRNNWSRTLRKICDQKREVDQIERLLLDYKTRSQKAIRSGSRLNISDVVHGALVGAALGTLFWWNQPTTTGSAITIVLGLGGVIYMILNIWTARRRSIKEWKRSEDQIQHIANVRKTQVQDR